MKQTVAGQIQSQLREWSRDPDEKKIAGVCAGISSHLDLPVTAIRAAFVLLALPTFSSIGIVLYLVLWFLMPAGPGEGSGFDRVVDAVGTLAGDRLPDRSGGEDVSRDRFHADHDPL